MEFKVLKNSWIFLLTFMLMAGKCSKEELVAGKVLVNNHITLSKKDKEFGALQAAFREQLVQWVNQGVPGVQGYKTNSIIDKLIIPDTKLSKALILVNLDGNSPTDGMIDVFSGQKVSANWEFYKKGVPTFTTDLTYIVDTLQNKDLFLMNNALDQLIEDGLIKKGKINNKYFDKWLSK